MKYLITFLIILMFFPTCCNEEAIETEKIALTKNEAQLIPYSLDESISFQHSNGFTFNFIVTEDNYSWDSYTSCDECCGAEYTTFQQRYVYLESEYPEFNISLSINSLQNFEGDPKNMNVEINSYYFISEYDANSNFICEKEICYDELVINGKTYFNVIESKLMGYNSNNSVQLYPQSILYNKTYGLIRIKMSNNETYTLNN